MYFPECLENKQVCDWSSHCFYNVHFINSYALELKQKRIHVCQEHCSLDYEIVCTENQLVKQWDISSTKAYKTLNHKFSLWFYIM